MSAAYPNPAAGAHAVYPSLAGRIGNTPLLRLARIGGDVRAVEWWVKAEWANPGGSVKDRAARAMLAAAVAGGRLRRGGVVLDATSGNTGIALAMLGAAQGYRVHLCLPAHASRERQRILRAYGAELTLTDPQLGMDGAIARARAIAAAHPEVCYLDQYSNDANWKAHYFGTAEEIWRQTGGQLTHFIAGLGTSGTFTGVTRRLRELNPAIQCLAVQPDSPFHGIEGLKHMASAQRPAIYDPQLADAQLTVSTEAAYAAVRRLAREEGLLVGISSGAALAAALAAAERFARPARVVLIFPDNADKYLNDRFWEEDSAPQ